MNGIMNNLIAVLLAIIGLATVAVLVSNNANTSGVIAATAGGLSKAITAAVAPVAGAPNGSGPGFSINLAH